MYSLSIHDVPPKKTQAWTTWPELDDCVWKVINDWAKNHRGPLNFRKCLALVIINKGSTGVQVRLDHRCWWWLA
jgi:hypothetical protein